MISFVFLKITRVILFASVRIGWVWPACAILKHAIKPAWITYKPEAPSLLALSGERARGDIEVLAGLESYNIYTISGDWLFILYNAQYGFKKRLIADLFNPKNDGDVFARRKKYRRFLSKLIPNLYSSMNIDGVIGFAVHYRQDYDLGAESDSMGFPYIVLHRENMFDNKGHRRYLEYKSSVMGKFSGSLIITHNEVTRTQFVNSGFSKSEQVLSLGCLRMDAWLRDLCSSDRSSRGETVVLFSFPPGVGILLSEQVDSGENKNWPPNGRGLHSFFYSVHGAFCDIANALPHVPFIIKTKGGRRYLDEIRKSCAIKGLDLDSIKNLRITDSDNTHGLIKRASVVVSFGSTVILESGMVGKHSIMPLYGEAESERWVDYLHFAEDLDAFYIAKSEAELKSIILEKISSPNFPEDKTRRCRQLFDKYVSPLSGDATRRYRNAIDQCLKMQKSQAEVGIKKK